MLVIVTDEKEEENLMVGCNDDYKYRLIEN